MSVLPSHTSTQDVERLADELAKEAGSGSGVAPHVPTIEGRSAPKRTNKRNKRKEPARPTRREVHRTESRARGGASNRVRYAAFISYAKADKTLAFAIVDYIEARGLQCWIAPRDVEVGRIFADEIIRGIERSRCFIHVLSRAANRSRWVHGEVLHAFNKRKKICCVRVEEVQPSRKIRLMLDNKHWKDAWDPGTFAERAREVADWVVEKQPKSTLLKPPDTTQEDDIDVQPPQPIGHFEPEKPEASASQTPVEPSTKPDDWPVGPGPITGRNIWPLRAALALLGLAVGVWLALIYDGERQGESGAKPDAAQDEHSIKYPPGKEFTDCKVCPTMVVVPAREFTMGSPSDEKDRNDNEGPQHEVTFAKPFAIGKYEVTFDEWDACVADGGCNGYKPDAAGRGRGQLPVINVNWNDADVYTAWLSKKTGDHYRLPSEAEWEYAARGGTPGPFWWGDAITKADANYGEGQIGPPTTKRVSPPTTKKRGLFGGIFRSGDRKVEENRPKPTSVESKTASVSGFESNPFGLYNVHGNVWEWVKDCWHDNYDGAPADGSAWTASADCDLRRVLRSGSWAQPSNHLRSASRTPGSVTGRNTETGFRVAKTLP